MIQPKKMNGIQYLYDHHLIFPALITSLIILWSITKWLRKLDDVIDGSKKNKNFPPGPTKLPVIGNLHLLSSSSHKDLRALSQRYGPLMRFHFGDRPPALIVSSADVAREVMKTHDLTFASRPKLYGFQKKLVYGGKDVTFSPYGENWRRLKSILVLHVLNSKRVQSFRYIREEEIDLVVERIIAEESHHRPVNLTEIFYNFTNDVICRSAFGRKYSDSEDGKKILPLLKEPGMLLGKFSLELVPCLRWINRVNGLYKRVDRVSREVDEFLEGLIEERMRNPKTQADSREENGEDCFVDIILENYNDKTDGVSFDRDSLKGLIMDVYTGGTDSTAGTLEWVMTEILAHPNVMEKLQKEVREIVRDKHDITDDDLKKMHYLKAVIKETIRLYPQNPLLVPRLARNDVKIKGYDVSAGTVVMINSWAISRDPESWQEPEKFMPERFLNSSIDFKGLDYELTPFGAGRRGCPGIEFAEASIEIMIANLMHKFDWKLPGGAQGKDLDKTEYHESPIRRATPLVALATQPK